MGRFLSVKCDCGEECVVYSDSKSAVNCAKCGANIVSPSGGKARVNGRILEILQ